MPVLQTHFTIILKDFLALGKFNCLLNKLDEVKLELSSMKYPLGKLLNKFAQFQVAQVRLLVTFSYQVKASPEGATDPYDRRDRNSCS